MDLPVFREARNEHLQGKRAKGSPENCEFHKGKLLTMLDVHMKSLLDFQLKSMLDVQMKSMLDFQLKSMLDLHMN